MAVTIESRYSRSIHPLHAVLLAGTVPLFLCAALSDAEYACSIGAYDWIEIGRQQLS